ncbi:secretin N-terminal domain-containing protein [Novipirellula herctigrandis]
MRCFLVVVFAGKPVLTATRRKRNVVSSRQNPAPSRVFRFGSAILLVIASATPAWCQLTANQLRGPESISAPLPVAPLPVEDVPNNPLENGPQTNGSTIRMNLQGEVALDALVGYLSKRLNIKFEYDEAIAKRQITIRTPEEIPIESLPILLGNVLRTEGLALIDSDREGWKRIVEVREMAPLSQIRRGSLARDPNAKPPTKITANITAPLSQSINPATPITQVFVLENLAATSVADVLRPFLSGEGANLAAVPESNTLIVTDYAASIDTLADLINLVDQPAGKAGFLIYEAKHQSAETLSVQVESLLQTKSSVNSNESKFEIVPQPLGNRIIIAGSTGLVSQAEQLLNRLDIELGVTTAVYRIRNTTAERINRLIGGFIEPPNDTESAYQSTVDEEGNLLIIRAPADVHRQIEKLIRELDTAVDSNESPIQFYKLKNASAIDVLYSLLALQEAVGAGYQTNANFYGPFGGVAQAGFPTTGLPGVFNPAMGYAGGNTGALGNNSSITQLPLTPNSGTRTALATQQSNPLARPTLASGRSGTNDAANGMRAGEFGAGQLRASGQLGSTLGGGFGAGGVATLPGGARVSADISTNSLIVYAPANTQPMYAKLIESLDQRRPQVLIEAKVVAVSTTDDYTLGVEVSAGDREGVKRLFKFSSFGLSEVNPDTGALRIIPGLGFNGTLIDPEVADVVVRALAQHQRSRVLAAPKILVNDNSTGTLESVVSVPFSSVNASDTVATTSLGGDQQAGTIITVTPHINEDDHLQLEFDVEFSTFSGQGADGLPPPRQIDRVGSIVTIPSGKTVVVGGLKRMGETNDFSGIPWAERIPVIRELTSRTDDNYSTTSFFLFIRPVVLRDSRFADLKYLSQNELNESCLPGDYPTSRPELIH